LRDEHGRPMRWYVAVTDIENRNQAEQRLQNENVALREEIDRASMFEEVGGGSPALHAVLSRVSKVAPTDSTVLITGETGTGKELIARAVHKRSQRCSRAFVSVNCAPIPRDLIASELPERIQRPGRDYAHALPSCPRLRHGCGKRSACPVANQPIAVSRQADVPSPGNVDQAPGGSAF
jgi:hypothetical protein